jgi:hypothetical protein
MLPSEKTAGFEIWPGTETARGQGVDAIELSRGGRDVQKRLSPGVALAKFDLHAWIPGARGPERRKPAVCW